MYEVIEKKYDNIKVELKLSKGYSLNSGSNEINDLVFYDEKMINSSIDQIFLKKYEKLKILYLEIMSSDDDSDEDIALIINEFDRLETLILNKFRGFITEAKLKSLMKEIYMTRGNLTAKLLTIYHKENQMIENSNKSR